VDRSWPGPGRSGTRPDEPSHHQEALGRTKTEVEAQAPGLSEGAIDRGRTGGQAAESSQTKETWLAEGSWAQGGVQAPVSFRDTAGLTKTGSGQLWRAPQMEGRVPGYAHRRILANADCLTR